MGSTPFPQETPTPPQECGEYRNSFAPSRRPEVGVESLESTEKASVVKDTSNSSEESSPKAQSSAEVRKAGERFEHAAFIKTGTQYKEPQEIKQEDDDDEDASIRKRLDIWERITVNHHALRMTKAGETIESYIAYNNDTVLKNDYRNQDLHSILDKQHELASLLPTLSRPALKGTMKALQLLSSCIDDEQAEDAGFAASGLYSRSLSKMLATLLDGGTPEATLLSVVFDHIGQLQANTEYYRKQLQRARTKYEILELENEASDNAKQFFELAKFEDDMLLVEVDPHSITELIAVGTSDEATTRTVGSQTIESSKPMLERCQSLAQQIRAEKERKLREKRDRLLRIAEERKRMENEHREAQQRMEEEHQRLEAEVAKEMAKQSKK